MYQTLKEGEDFFPLLGQSTGGRPKTEYYLKMDTAKEIAMAITKLKGVLPIDWLNLFPVTSAM